uniref:G_PROTEIN_RECEP_F3_4 domain-containing protein n=1 Tax=Steinernema glaseri TaxID=37863 RepID=A0A1I8A5S1_9BILA
MLLGSLLVLLAAAAAVPTRDDPPKASWLPRHESELSRLLEQLDDVSECNRTVAGPLLRRLLERSMGDTHLQLLWLAKLVAEHPHVLNRELPMNASLSSQPPIRPPNSTHAIYSLRLECPKSVPAPPSGQATTHPLTPTWTPLLVIPTPLSNSFLTVRLPVESLDTCSFSSCANKCSWTIHGGLRVYARVCCGAESDAEMCRANTESFRKPLFLWTGCCSVICVLLIGVVVRERRQSQNEGRGWALMELFLVGAALLYFIPLLDYFSPPSGSCLGFIWLRQIGFATFYGSIVLKIYRNLQEYRVRKAHHVIVKEQDLLKYLSTILVATLTSLVAYTFGVWGDAELWSSAWPQCPPQNWFYAWQVIELLFLLHGMRLCYKARNSSWLERWQFTVAVCLEAVITLMASLITYSIRHSGHSDTLLMVLFVQEQLTVTVSVVIIMAPKSLQVTSESNRRTLTMSGSSGRAHPSLAKLRDNILNGTIDFAEVPIGDMNPDDIRAELKRVYTQLRMYKLRSIYTENPHISKRKGGKKSSDKSGKNRRISIPPTSSSPKVRKVDEEDEEKSDLTVESAPHNVYLSTYKLQLEPDHSVRV